jgi:opacity protein-like surface antigen
MNTIRTVFLAAIVLIAAAAPGYVFASDFEITPFAGYTWGGGFTDTTTGDKLTANENSNYGIMLDFKQTDESQIELYFSRQATRLESNASGFYAGTPLFDLNIDYYHIGGTALVGEGEGKVKPFVVGTIGATYMAPKGAGYDSVTKFSLGLGGGAKILITDHIGLRLEGRWFGTFFDGSGSAFCANGACAINVQGDVFSQFVANAGIVVGF